MPKVKFLNTVPHHAYTLHQARASLLGLAMGCLIWPGLAQADGVFGTWSGFYVCSQGRTAFTLEVDVTGDGTIAFGPHPGNPNIPRGSYEVKVRSAPPRVKIDAGEWLDQPTGYIAVGMEGVLSKDRQAISGQVEHATCATFDLHRQNGPEGEAISASKSPPDAPQSTEQESVVTPGQLSQPGTSDTAPVKPEVPVDLERGELVQDGSNDEAPTSPSKDTDVGLDDSTSPAQQTRLHTSPATVVIPSVAWPTSMIRLIDAAGFRILIDLNGEPCTAPSFAVEIDSPALLAVVQKNMAGKISYAYLPFESSGACGAQLGWNMKVAPAPVHYLGERVGSIEGLILPAVGGRPATYVGATVLSRSSDAAVAAEQAHLDRYWTAVLAQGSEFTVGKGGMPPDDQSALMAAAAKSIPVAEVVVLVTDGLPPIGRPCSAPWLVSTKDIGRLRRAADIGSPLSACRVAAILEQEVQIDVEGIARGKIALKVAPFTKDPERLGKYLEATCLRAFAFAQRRYWSGMFHTVALDAARDEIEAATAFLAANPGVSCARFAEVAGRLQLSDEVSVDTTFEGAGVPGSTLSKPPKIPQNKLFSLADDHGVGFAAGVATVLEKCSLTLPEEDTMTIMRFALNGVVTAGGGSDYAGNRIIDSMLEGGLGFVAGMAEGRSLNCEEPKASETGAAIVDLVNQARNEGEAFGRPFLNGCEAESRVFTKTGCECAAQVGLVVLPDIYARPYSSKLFEEIGRNNPALYLNVFSLCGVGQFRP